MKRWLAAELLLLTLLAAAAGAVVAWRVGDWGWNWDALNHHIYLGLTAESPRWQLDVVAVNTQVYQYPYLYWPIYRIAMMSGSGLHMAMAWAAMQAALLLPPVWLMAHRLLTPQEVDPWQAMLQRAAACALAAMNGVLVLGINLSSNDLLATLPLVWAIALHLGAPESDRRAALCAALWGMSTAFKWSNGLMLPVLLVWWWQRTRPHFPLRRGLALALGAASGFGLTYAPWGWQLWQATGNPFFPYFQAIFGGY